MKNLVLSAKIKLNSIKVIISGAFVDSYISHNEFTSIINLIIKQYYLTV